MSDGLLSRVPSSRPRFPGRRTAAARPPVRSALVPALSAACALAVVPGTAPGQETPTAGGATVPRPEDVLGFRPGEDRRLATWERISAYFDTLAAASDRVRIDTIGRSTLDRPLTLLVVSSAANLSRLEELRDIQERLADPRRIGSAEERADLLRRGRLVVAITTGLHSTEVASTLLPVRLAHRLATSSSPDVLRILDETVLLLVPSMNPDGVDVVTEWYRSTIDMPWEGSEPPYLYHHYAGHDNNRDWYAFALQETRVVVEGLYHAWRPQLVLDVHQQRPDGSRMFVPPWVDPVEPNVDPLLVSGATALGSSIAWSMLQEGRSGILVSGEFDAWSPARAYAHYHGGTRILMEVAGSRLASPVTVSVDRLRSGRGFDVRHASWNFPRPWRGGRWTLANALDYMESGAMAMLREASQERSEWLRSFVAVGERATAGRPGWPRAWAIPPGRHDPEAADALVAALVTGGVEVDRALAPFEVDGVEFPAGTYLVGMRQPYAAFAQVLLAPQPYPPSFEPGGTRPEAPYDGTAHALALLLGAEVRALESDPTVPRRRVTEIERPRLVAPGLSGDPGTLVGVYRPWIATADEGWARWWFDRANVPYVLLDNDDVAAGDLSRRFTAILLPSATEAVLSDGWRSGEQPPAFTGGLGGAGVAALRRFVEEGGTLVALNRASRFAIRALGLPIRDLSAEERPEDYLAPGALVSLVVDTTAAIGRDLPPRTAAWLDGGGAFRPAPGSGARVLARYGSEPVVLSGWVHGEGRIAGGAALVEMPLGRGTVVLFGFDPQYRGQARATMPLLFRSLSRPGAGRPDGSTAGGPQDSAATGQDL